jgi:ribosomal protein L37AE/L43A
MDERYHHCEVCKCHTHQQKLTGRWLCLRCGTSYAVVDIVRNKTLIRRRKNEKDSS